MNKINSIVFPRLVFLFVFFAFFINAVIPCKADITYSPLYVLIYAPNGNGFGSMNITNPTGQPVRMQLDLLDWEFTDNGEVRILEKDPSKESITKYIKISPRQFTLPPMQKKVVRIACNIPSTYPDNQEFKLLLNMTEIGADRKMFEGPGSETGKATYGLVINKAVNAGTYVRKGAPANFKTDIRFNNASIQRSGNEVLYKFEYQNLGNMHGRREIGVKYFDKAGKLVYEQPSVGGLIIFPNPDKPKVWESSFTFPSDKISADSEYDIEFVIKDDSLEAINGSKPDPVYNSGKIALPKG